MSTKEQPAAAGQVERPVRPRAPHVDAVMKHVYRVIGAGAQWTHEHIAAIETELWRVLDEERNAERERCAKVIDDMRSETGWIGKKEAVRKIREA